MKAYFDCIAQFKKDMNTILELKPSITQIHMQKLITLTSNHRHHPFFRKFLTEENLQKMLKHITETEYNLADEYYTFVHAQKWNYRLCEEFFTKLWEIKFNKRTSDFVFAHVKSFTKTGELSV